MFNLKKYIKGTVCIEIESFYPEKFVNLLWKNNISVKKISKRNITTMSMEVKLVDFDKIKILAQKSSTKIKITGRIGLSFYIINMKKRTALFCGLFLFLGVLYYLSTFIWGIDIQTEKIVPPYEVRQQLSAMGIKSGINKKMVNVTSVEENLIKVNDNISWARVRIDGSRLKVRIIERLDPPNVLKDETPCNIVAKNDGVVSRVYTSAGTSVVKAGDIVTKGQLLVKGEQGKDGNVYPVHASGEVIAKTFYEKTKTVPLVETKRTRTGESFTNYYIEINNKKIYFKNSVKNYDNYDKIISNIGLLKKETYYKVKEENNSVDIKKVIKDSEDELYNDIMKDLPKSVKILDRKTETAELTDSCNIRVWVTVEEDIAVQEKNQ
ncbi:MAG: sporulation protein YqfD [Bacillota bacterium]|nr:sporulation protein YqfD [Bacillota bacterium]